MAIRIAEVEGADAAGVRVPIRQPLRSRRRVLDLELFQALVRSRHVADDDCRVLKHAIVGPDISRHRASLGREILGQLDRFSAEPTAAR